MRSDPAAASTAEPHASDFRVCIVSANLPPVYGGAEIAAFRYAERLAIRGAGPILLAPTSGERLKSSDLPAFVRAVEQPRAKLAGIAERVWPELYRLRRHYDIVHIFNSRPLFNLMAVPAARALRKPIILEMSLLGSDDPLTLRARIRRNGRPPVRRQALRYLLFRQASAYVSKSAPLTQAFAESGLPRAKLWEIPYAVDMRLYHPPSAEEKDALRGRLGLPPSETIILFVGGLSPRKGVQELLRAFRQVLHRCPRSRLVLAGPGDKYDPGYVKSLHRYVEEAELEDKVAFVTRLVPNVDEFMRAADIFVLPSSREGLPISVLEAMSCGLAVVASDIPEISSSQIRDGLEGILVPAGHEDGLADALGRLIEDAAARDRLGQAARRRVKDEFSIDVVDRRYGSLYARLLDGPSATGRLGGRKEPEAIGGMRK